MPGREAALLNHTSYAVGVTQRVPGAACRPQTSLRGVPCTSTVIHRTYTVLHQCLFAAVLSLSRSSGSQRFDLKIYEILL